MISAFEVLNEHDEDSIALPWSICMCHTLTDEESCPQFVKTCKMRVWIHFNLSLIKKNIDLTSCIFVIFFIIKIYFNIHDIYKVYRKCFPLIGLLIFILKKIHYPFKMQWCYKFCQDDNQELAVCQHFGHFNNSGLKGVFLKIKLSRWLKDKIGKSFIIIAFSQQKNVF